MSERNEVWWENVGEENPRVDNKPHTDKNGIVLPHPSHEFELEIRDSPLYPVKCSNCKVDSKNGQRFTMRRFGGPSKNDRLQGPLCPQCSELPPEHLESRKIGERWW